MLKLNRKKRRIFKLFVEYECKQINYHLMIWLKLENKSISNEKKEEIMG